MTEMPSRDDITIAATYLEAALHSRWFIPARPPKEELDRVRLLFQLSLEERVRPPEELLQEQEWSSGNVSMVMLRHLYVCVPGKETPVSFLAAIRFLNLLGMADTMISEGEEQFGQQVLKTLHRLCDIDTMVSVIHSQLGIYLNR